jgi:Na+/H+ antiporter NhaC
VSGGPGELLEDFGRRLDRSVSIITSTVGQFAVFVAGVAVLASSAALRPRFVVLDAFLIAIAVSLVVNDSPTKVVGFGAILAGALRAWSVSSAPIKSPR